MADKQTLIDFKLSYLKYNVYGTYRLISNTIRKLLSKIVTYIDRYQKSTKDENFF